MNTWASKKGFTIIELIVAITVIAILAAIMIVSYTGIQQRSRDSQRESDTMQLKIAIEKYRADRSQYPDACPGGNGNPCAISNLTTPLTQYLSKIPHDPSRPVDSAMDYQYVRDAANTDSYGILVSYEAKVVCKTGVNINPVWWGAGVPSC
ncbi:MAG: prepilin-type N-terminal cleavage/methylation domain-containing protein [Candidatus Microsaccharimonas sossegonensis]|uniref:Prepilin-type N-terminal cleavage/methylation domain-containing protein n=1 Tax=Candidatus Microsaccharimonas sossegonensis TaxID=2506948 RepID=A0A4Q0AGU8_9BACT|nr:MAG: prepilin-type N-terminal cleavage/methylation domain-containing protein [Candidatus Microsaccharimonas sossegonensis]